MSSPCLVAAFAVILISHAEATETNASQSTTFISNTITTLLEFKIADTENSSAAIHDKYVAKIRNAYKTGQNLPDSHYDNPIVADQHNGENVERCLNSTAEAIDFMLTKYVARLDFCMVEHMPDNATIEAKFGRWQTRGDRLEKKINRDPRCYGEKCADHCDPLDCTALQDAVLGWKSNGQTIQSRIQYLNRTRKVQTIKCFNAANRLFKMELTVRSKALQSCIELAH
ncbi:uncharacterized protein LOC135161595 [Diachasmimorpha longicaudata]|uniref:uncharacterized protein LOC135161595 n=1 Tax=Diachasmimorpha longicaudata TaxID=58733 RepID=UPI0030B8E3EE